MDSLSQFLMGSAIGQIVIGPKHKGKGALIGGLAGSLPDLDILPLMGSSIVTQLNHHRGFSHSIILCIIAPPLMAWLCKKWLSWSLSFKRWLAFWFLAFSTHIVLDLMTTWGTQILWPFPTRFALDALFIIDPLLTIPLLVGCLVAKYYRSASPAVWGVGLASIYMIWAFSAHAFSYHLFKEALNHRDISFESFMVRPTPFNTLYWSVTAITPEDELVMGYARLWDSPEEVLFSLPIPQNSNLLTDVINREDVSFMISITKGYYVIESNEATLTIKDARFGRYGGWANIKTNRFVFNYVLDLSSYEWTQFRPPMPNAKLLVSSLIKNITH